MVNCVVPVSADNPPAYNLVLVSLPRTKLEIILDLPFGFPINNIISLGPKDDFPQKRRSGSASLEIQV